jgi:hypothetical protein
MRRKPTFAGGTKLGLRMAWIELLADWRFSGKTAEMLTFLRPPRCPR